MVTLSREGLAVLVLAMLISGFLGGMIYTAIVRPLSKTTETYPLYIREKTTVTQTETITVYRTISPGETPPESAPPAVEAEAVIKIEPLSGEETLRMCAFICPVGVELQVEAHYGAINTPVVIGQEASKHSIKVVSVEGAVSKFYRSGLRIEPSSAKSKIVYLEVEAGGKPVRYASFSLVEIGGAMRSKAGVIEAWPCEAFMNAWNPLRRYDYSMLGGALVPLVTGKVQLPSAGKGFAVFEVPKNITLSELALEIRVPDLNQGTLYVIIIPLEEA